MLVRMPALTPRPLDWIDRAPVRATRSRRIAAPPAEVWAAIADHQAWVQWFGAITAVIPGEVAEGVGGTRRVQVGKVEVDEEFLAWEAERRFAFTVTESSAPGLRSMNEDVRLTPDGDDATTVTYTMALEPIGARFVRPVLEPALRKAIDGGLAGLAEYVES